MTKYNITSTKQWFEIGGNRVHHTAMVNWEQLDIGSGNEIGPYVCIGTDAQHRTEPSEGTIVIGDNNIIREYSTVNLPTRFWRNIVFFCKFCSRIFYQFSNKCRI